MSGSEVFIMGTGLADGPDRAMNAVRQALESPLLDSSSIRGTKDILLNIISGEEEITMGEIGEIIDYLQEEAGLDATIIWGNGTDRKLGDQISVTIIATGFDINPNRIFQNPSEVVELENENTEFDINLEDEIPFETVFAKDPVLEERRILQKEKERKSVKQAEKRKEKPKKGKSQPVNESEPENANVDSWFMRQFTKLFDDKDASVSEENNTH